MSVEETPEAVLHSNAMANVNYDMEGPGEGANEQAFDICDSVCPIVPGDHVVEIGFGQGYLVKEAAINGCYVLGIDITKAAQEDGRGIEDIRTQKCWENVKLRSLDCSHAKIPAEDDSFHHAFCTETIEHMSNPYFMCCEVKRVLKHGGTFTLAFPRPEDNLGYGNGEHAHIYPGFLVKDSWDRFMKQLYFNEVHYHENGSSGWYVYKNFKGPGVVDVFRMTTGNYDEQDLFGRLEAWNGE